MRLNPFAYFTEMDKRLPGSLLSLGGPRLTKFKGKHLTVSGRIFT